MSPQLFASTRLSITTLKKAQRLIGNHFLNSIVKKHRCGGWYPNKLQAERGISFDLPGRVCWFVVQGRGLPSSDFLGDRWPSRAGCQLALQLSVCAVWYAACQCVTRTCGTKRTHRGLSLGNWPQGWPAELPWSLEDLLLKCRWNSQIHLLDTITWITNRQKGKCDLH